jgi:hypothetical protein
MSDGKIMLDYPVKAHGVEVKSLQMRRPKVRDQLSVEKDKASDAEREVRLFANLTEQEPETIMDLDMKDYGKLQEAYKGFLSSAPRTPGGAA